MPSIYDTITVDLNGATPQQKQRVLQAVVGLHGGERREGETDPQLANRIILQYIKSEVAGWERKKKRDEGEVEVRKVNTEFPEE